MLERSLRVVRKRRSRRLAFPSAPRSNSSRLLPLAALTLQLMVCVLSRRLRARAARDGCLVERFDRSRRELLTDKASRGQDRRCLSGRQCASSPGALVRRASFDRRRRRDAERDTLSRKRATAALIVCGLERGSAVHGAPDRRVKKASFARSRTRKARRGQLASRIRGWF